MIEETEDIEIEIETGIAIKIEEIVIVKIGVLAGKEIETMIGKGEIIFFNYFSICFRSLYYPNARKVLA